MTFEQIVAVALGLNGLITLGNALYNITSASGSRALAELKKMAEGQAADTAARQRAQSAAESRFQLVESRVTMIERDLSHLPSKESVSEVKLEIAGLRGVVGTLDTTIKGIDRTVNLLDEYIRHQESKK